MCTLKRLGGTLAVGVAAFFGIAVPSAHATPFTFNFNSPSLTPPADNTAVQAYMQGIIGAGAVTVTGAKAEQTYNGDGHVVGPSGVSETLGTSDFGVHHAAPNDTFITNLGGEGPGNDRITMTFTIPIYSVSFDYEIFPDGSCKSLSDCTGGLPDLEFYADSVLQRQWFGGVPSGSSPKSGSEQAPQLLGQSGVFSFAGSGVTKLEFVDWPQKIGIDNLKVNVPEPSTLLLLGSGLAGLARAAWKRRN